MGPEGRLRKADEGAEWHDRPRDEHPHAGPGGQHQPHPHPHLAPGAGSLRQDGPQDGAQGGHGPPARLLCTMARVNMMKTIVTDRRQPHSPLDNVNTPYNPIRLLKGAPPGQEAVNHYISELAIEKKNNHKLFGEGAGADRDMKFYAPQMVQDYINQIRRF